MHKKKKCKQKYILQELWKWNTVKMEHKTQQKAWKCGILKMLFFCILCCQRTLWCFLKNDSHESLINRAENWRGHLSKRQHLIRIFIKKQGQGRGSLLHDKCDHISWNTNYKSSTPWQYDCLWTKIAWLRWWTLR